MAHQVMVDPLGDQTAGFTQGGFRMMDAIQRGAGLERGQVVGADLPQLAVGGDDGTYYSCYDTGTTLNVFFASWMSGFTLDQCIRAASVNYNLQNLNGLQPEQLCQRLRRVGGDAIPGFRGAIGITGVDENRADRAARQFQMTIRSKVVSSKRLHGFLLS